MSGKAYIWGLKMSKNFVSIWVVPIKHRLRQTKLFFSWLTIKSSVIVVPHFACTLSYGKKREGESYLRGLIGVGGGRGGRAYDQGNI